MISVYLLLDLYAWYGYSLYVYLPFLRKLSIKNEEIVIK